MTDVFISFVQEDKAVAETVKRILEYELRPQVKVFMTADQSQVLAGDDWLKRIKEELTQASIVILMLSKRSIKRPWVNLEAGAAWITGKRVIPVCFGNQSKASLPHPYSLWQAVQIPDDEQYLVTTVAGALGMAKPAAARGKMSTAVASESPASLFYDPALGRKLNRVLENWKDES
jgi:hypothetical protein